MSKVVNSRKAVMIGCGFVGSASVFALMQSGLFTALFACLSALGFPFLPVARLLLLRTCVGFCTRLKHGFVPFRKIFAEHRRIPHLELILDQPVAAADFFNRFLWQWF